MSERKVLNKYYPPDFDPSKIPRARQGKNRQFTVRLMAPCNMRCNTCGEYIYKGKKFNARKEDVENETYLGIRIYRFYIKCTRCLQEISFKTDPESTDYIIEAGATRNFMALKLAEEQAEREEQAEKEDEATNPMKVLEKRTQASRHEMAVIEALEELKELNQRQITPNYDNLFEKFAEEKQLETRTEEEEDEAFIRSIFGKEGPVVKRIEDDESSDDDKPPTKKFLHLDAELDSSIWKNDTGKDSKMQNGEKQTDKGNSFSHQKKALSKLIKVTPKTKVATPKEESTSSVQPSSETKPIRTPSDSKCTDSSNKPEESHFSSAVASKKPGLTLGLNLLGAYGSDNSDSESNDDNS